MAPANNPSSIATFARSLRGRLALAGGVFLLAGALAACGGDDAPATPTAATPTAAATTATATQTEATTPDTTPAAADPFEGVPGIVDASNHGWPRQVEGLNGIVTIEAQPQRIHTTSVGLDEVTLGLLPVSRLVAVGGSSQNPSFSNVADLVADLPAVGRNPEEIAATEPDLVLASPTQNADFVQALTNVEIPVVQVELRETPEARIEAILLLGYIYGEEERALALAEEVRERYDALVAVTEAFPGADRRSVAYLTNFSDTLRASGSGTTVEAITLAAGGTCAPCAAGMGSTETISMESILVIAPDVILIPMSGPEAEAFREALLAAPVLAEVPAIQAGEVHIVPVRLHQTLSYANVAAAEQLAAYLWPDDFPAEYRDEPPLFSRPAE